MILYGGDYYPEQWKEAKDILQEDLSLMKKAHCNTVTLGVFAWSELEPEEGEYDFSFLDEMIDQIGKNGGNVILATPSGARPHWLADKYPEVMRTMENGMRRRFGNRHNHCYTSPVYRDKVREIDELLAKRYGTHPAVIAWHLSNEYGGECYCTLCQEAFRKFLKDKYGTVEALNRAYWFRFWSHRYDDFGQIEPPGPSGEESMPGLTLDWHRFVTFQTVDFMKNEISAIRKYSPHIPVTTNMMPGYYDLDYYKLAEHLDVISWDNYPSWHSPEHLCEAANSAFWHDFFRSLKGKPYLLMESAPGCVNWKSFNKLQRPGMHKLAAFQAVAHGSDSALYFQWRKGRGGAEKFHGAFVDHAGTENTRIFSEAARTGAALEKIGEIAGSAAAKAEVAILFDWENMWAYEGCSGFMQNKNYRAAVLAYHEILWQMAVACDIVHPHADLSGYKLVIAVRQYVTDKETEENLSAYVNGGGTLFAAGFLGMTDENDLCHLGGFPGNALKEVFGLRNEETDILYPDETVKLHCLGKDYVAKGFCERLCPSGAKALGVYGSEFYAGTACVTENRYGKGKAYYQAFNDDGVFRRDFLAALIRQEKIVSVLPDAADRPGVTAHKRVDGKTEYLFVENYTDTVADKVRLDGQYTDMESGKTVDSVTLEAFGVRALKRTV